MQGQTLADLIEATRYQGGKPLSYESLSKNCGRKPTAQRLQQYVTVGLKNFPGPDTIHALQRGSGQSVPTVIRAAAPSRGLIVANANPDALVIAGVSKLSPSSLESLKVTSRELVTLTSEVHHEVQGKPETNPPGKCPLRAVGPSSKAGAGQKISEEISDAKLALVVKAATVRLVRVAQDNPEALNPEWVERRLTNSDWLRGVGFTRGMLDSPVFVKLFKEHLMKKIRAERELRIAFDRRHDHGSELLDYLEQSAGAGEGKPIPDRDDPAFLTPPPIEQLAAHPYFKTDHEKFEEPYGERGESNQEADPDS